MQQFLYIVIFVLLRCTASSQIFEAKYAVKQSLSLSFENTVIPYELNFEGFTYYSGNKFIYYQKPLFLKEYPEGEKVFKSPTNNYAIGNIGIDTIQRITYRNLDSLMAYIKVGSANDNTQFYTKYFFEIGARVFKLLPDIKIINGLHCQHASLYDSNDTSKVMVDIWFCSDIEINFGPADISDVPGLIVYANYYNTFEVFQLTSYKYNPDVTDSIFWPSEFSYANFTTSATVKKYQGKKKKTKDQLKAEIMKQ